eukprot:15197341-Ditylum_brightwellii.AAC.1
MLARHTIVSHATDQRADTRRWQQGQIPWGKVRWENCRVEKEEGQCKQTLHPRGCTGYKK